ncbi:MAG: 3-deoxy-7-phosphoheptulonate synthase [bacterium]|nr:3-deoxy-7-phosphoheptulonate synthase [bacterium]
MKKKWTENSWQQYPALQQPEYRDKEQYAAVLEMLKTFPPLTVVGEIESLKHQAALAGQGNYFILQGGDCAERFIDCNEQTITNKIKILLQMSVILTYGAKKPVIKIGRIAGQYSKPRSNPTEVIENRTFPIYRGDSVNRYEAEINDREPDPERLLTAFYKSVTTLNYIRAMITGGFADLHHPYNWNLYSIEQSKEWAQYKDTIERILDAINFMESFGGLRPESVGKTDFFTSHEGLLLGYEEALTRKDPVSGNFYNLGAHMLWIGERTREINGAHIEYFRGISNPLGIKIGPSIDTDELPELLNILNPNNEEGKITLITRMGIDKVEDSLPRIVKAVTRAGAKVIWSCDPMHGNSITTKGNIKTRDFDDILGEIKQTFRVHKENGTFPGGVHFELTGDDVTECTGGAADLQHTDLYKNYESYCDPRLNYSQSMEMAFLLAQLLRE